MKDFIILRRSSIAITNYKTIPSATLNSILVKLTKFDRPPHPNAPKPCTFKGYLTETKESNGKDIDILYLPFNYDINVLTTTFPNHEVVNMSKPIDSISYDDVTLNSEYDYKDEEQKDIVGFLHRSGIHKDIPFYGVDLIEAGTAAGKSYSYIRYWVESGAKRLMVGFANQSHLDNFKVELLKFTNLNDDEIYCVNGQASFKRIKDQHKVILIITRTISSSFNDVTEYINDPNPTSFKAIPHVTERPSIIKLVENLKIGDIVFDEMHLGLKAISPFMLLLNVNSITQLTATPNRSDYQEDRIFKYMIPEEYLAIEKEARLEVISYSYDLPFSSYNLMKCVGTRGFNNAIYHNKIEENYFEDWYDYLKVVINGIYENDENIGSIGIVLAAPLSFISNLKIRLNQDFSERSIGDYTSNISKKIRVNELDKDIVITTEKSFNGSVNPTKMNYMIFHGCLKSPVIIEQISGRLRGINGNSCIFIDFFNSSIPESRKFWKFRQKVFKNIAKVIYEEVSLSNI